MSTDPISYHRDHRGKIETKAKAPLKNADDLALAYTPGVAKVCERIAEEPREIQALTNRSNTVAIVSDGSAVLGLGNIGPEAALPVMEGKAMIFKAQADIDAVPLCINTQNTEEIIQFCKHIAPSFGGINLEDIAAPKCFDILKHLETELPIPVFHDDQDGTAIVTLAALLNAARLRESKVSELRIVVNGAGAAGIAITRLLRAYGVKDIVLVDSKGIVSSNRTDLNPYKKRIAKDSNPRALSGDITVALKGADVFIGVSKCCILSEHMVRTMADHPIIFAMANPKPEIMPENAHAAGAYIVGTGRSDFPNQINNALVFPGIFRGLLDAHTFPRKCVISEHMVEVKIAAAKAIAGVIEPSVDYILPDVMDPAVVPAIRGAICA
ncbi:MAG: NADP-dependent malic enzyme [Parcubacteria group bacterium]|nr:NADP-dependent malic enzyme [Parcubacteria group bacterium]